MTQLETIAKKGILPKTAKKVKKGLYRSLGVDRILAVYRMSKVLKKVPNYY